MRLADILDTDDNTPTDLYRYYDRDGCLLYVGVSKAAVVRSMQHAHTASWWAEWATMTREAFPSRGAALAAERAAIVSERPRCNIVHAQHALFPRSA